MHEISDTKVTIDITKLREEGRPLWMSPLGIDHPADMLGNGGDIWSDRLTPEWPRFTGEELAGEESDEMKGFEGEIPDEMNFSPKGERLETLEEAFSYVHSPEERGETGGVEAAGSQASSSEEHKSSTKEEKKGGLGVGLDVNLDIG